MSFADLGLSDELLRAVTEAGYSEPTPIQAQAIPPVLMNRDLVGIAQTGTGKTASFVLPLIDILAQGRARAMMPRSLILEPTRELAAQVAENFEKYGKYHKLSMALLIGGVSMGDQTAALQKGVDVLIATPGRLMDLFARGKILLSGCSILVIDEADRMLDMGFIPDIEAICTKLLATRQTLLFSATMPPVIKKLADRFLSNPKQIEVARPASSNLLIEQMVVETSARDKRKVLRDLLARDEVRTAIVFSNRKTTVRDLTEALRKSGLKAGQIHGDMEQPERIRELDRFKAGEITILVASDVAARGLDIKGVSHVFNFDVPWHPDDYIHRIGRTGRAGATGTAYTLVAPDDAEAIGNIEKLIGIAIPRMGAPAAAERAAEPVEAAPAASGEPVPAEQPRRSRTRGGRDRDRKPREERAARPPLPEPEAPGVGDGPAPVPITDAPDASIDTPPERAETHPARPPSREGGGTPLPARAPARQTERAPRDDRRDRRPPADAPDDGWNGPVPSFLDFGFGTTPER